MLSVVLRVDWSNPPEGLQSCLPAVETFQIGAMLEEEGDQPADVDGDS